jgi:hypothetical protein
VNPKHVLACASCFLLLQSCTSPTSQRATGPGTTEASSSQSSVTPIPASTPTQASLPRVAKKLGPPPTDCTGPAPDPQPVVRHYGSLDGEKPIWGGIYAGYRPEHQAFYASDARRRKYGFRIKLLWIIHPRHDTPVTIAGRDVDNDKPIYFDVGGTGNPVTTAELDPNNPGTVPEHEWREYPSYLFFSRAGCYELEAKWDGGKWRRVFGFGR